jgi:nucleoside phosphorylase/cellulose biosynthesis protein BcsQ
MTPGQVITFYSYKGGTGRTMALANVACLLAGRKETERGVLMIDWDLEAPGLHRFFYPGRIEKGMPTKKMIWVDDTFEKSPGLIDLFIHLKEQIQAAIPEEDFQTDEQAREMLGGIDFSQYIRQVEVDGVSLLKAGSFGDDYSKRVNTFDWETLHNRSPWLFRAFAELLAEKYDYVLIDSRTGITDTSGICTMIMPEKLVVVFVPNQQSLMGVANLVRRAVEFRKDSDDLRPLSVFPLASRIEVNEVDLQRQWRDGDPTRGIKGYQLLFEELLKDTYALPTCDLQNYFIEIKIKQVPYYAYGEEISVLRDPPNDDFYPAFGYSNFTDVLLSLEGPWNFIRKASPGSIDIRLSRNTAKAPPGSILIVTVTKVEAQAVLDLFSRVAGEKWTRQSIGDKTYYNLGVHGGAPVFMVQSEMGTATPGGTLLTVRQAIQNLRPQAVIICGIAFGLRPGKQQLGDILVAKQLQYYEPQKVDLQRGQIPRGDRVTVSERLLDRFRSGDNDWQGAPTHFGLVLSGEKLVNDPAFRDLLLKAEPEAIGGEMEGTGLYAAAYDAKVDWIMVKAICDWADGSKNPDDSRSVAARNAAQFVLHVLQQGGWAETWY